MGRGLCWRKRGREAVGGTDHRLSESPHSSGGQSSQGQGRQQEGTLPLGTTVLKSPPKTAPAAGPGPAQQPHRQESSPNFCEQDKHTARPGLTQLPLGWAPNHQRNSLPAQAPGFPHIRALGFWFEVLSSGIPFGGSQTQALGSRVQRLNQSPRFRMQALACRSSPGLWFVPPGVGSLVKRSTLLASSQALCSVSI